MSTQEAPQFDFDPSHSFVPEHTASPSDGPENGSLQDATSALVVHTGLKLAGEPNRIPVSPGQIDAHYQAAQAYGVDFSLQRPERQEGAQPHVVVEFGSLGPRQNPGHLGAWVNVFEGQKLHTASLQRNTRSRQA